jgi:hypothetical protein
LFFIFLRKLKLGTYAKSQITILPISFTKRRSLFRVLWGID